MKPGGHKEILERKILRQANVIRQMRCTTCKKDSPPQRNAGSADARFASEGQGFRGLGFIWFVGLIGFIRFIGFIGFRV